MYTWFISMTAINIASMAHAQSDFVEAKRPVLGVLGSSAQFAEILEQARTVAPLESTVLILGETGTGKEVIARAIHEMSQRGGPFVRVNCASIPATLLESELMGHERGAFTGAVSQRIGRFERAKDGTIFLDEIGELTLDLQPKLLRLLQEREFERLGGDRTLRTNARVVAATNCNLRAMVRERKFREDLYYRLNVFPISIPPLRRRPGDALQLALHFVRTLSQRMGKPAPALTPAVEQKILGHHWPGNVRELHNMIERALIITRGHELELPDFDSITPLTADDPRPDPPGSGDHTSSAIGHCESDGLAAVNRAHILRVLRDTNWVVSGPNGAAARLQMKRSTLNFRMRKLGIARPRHAVPGSPSAGVDS